jgi:ATP-dependent DNA ligase
VCYVVFYLLYHEGCCLLREPLTRRQEALAALCRQLMVPEVRFSDAVVGAGRALYAAVVAQGHEGVMAKHLASPYRPGRRSAAWRKIKPQPHLLYHLVQPEVARQHINVAHSEVAEAQSAAVKGHAP